MAKLSVKQALAKAKLHVEVGDTIAAQTLYAAILEAFPHNKIARTSLASLERDHHSISKTNPPQGVTDRLMSLYKKGQLKIVARRSQDLILQFPESVPLWNILGVASAQIGELDRAVEAFAQIISLDPSQASAYFNMGNALKDQGNLKEAIDAYNKAIVIKPDYKAALNNVAIALQAQGLSSAEKLKERSANEPVEKTENAKLLYQIARDLQVRGKLEEALETYSKALVIKPDYAEVYLNMGAAFQNQGKLGKAIEAYSKVLEIKPDYAQAHYNIGNTLNAQGKLGKAIEAYSKALEIKPDYAQAYLNMGVALQNLGKLEEAIEAHNKALEIKPDYAQAYLNMGAVLKDQGKLEDAIAAYDQALIINPDYVEIYINMGAALYVKGEPAKAIEAYNKALEIKPDCAQAYLNMGVALKDQGRLEAAIASYRKSIEIKPTYAEAHHHLSFSLLSSGKLDEGLEEYEWRWKMTKNAPTKRQFSKPLWDGKENLKGKRILLWCEQGVGDTINWSSKLPLVETLAEHCIFECPEKLVPLMARSFPSVEVQAENKTKQRNDFDYHLPLGSLYRHFLPEILKITKPEAFLVPDPDRIKFWTRRLTSLGQGPYVGVSWKSSNMSLERLPNYASINDWSPIFSIPDVTFVNLQYTNWFGDLTEIQNKFGVTVHNFDDLDHYNNLDDVAALCAALDIVISTKITVPLISSGTGTVTKLANWRQSSWNNMLLNPAGPLLDVFEKNTWEPWQETFSAIAKDVTDTFNK